MTATVIVLTVLGAALVGFSTWERLGRGKNARAWVSSPGTRAVHMALFVRPGVGLALLGLGLIEPLGDVPVLGYVVAFLAMVGVVLLFWGILRLPIPSWWLPSFARDRWEKDKARERGE